MRNFCICRIGCGKNTSWEEVPYSYLGDLNDDECSEQCKLLGEKYCIYGLGIRNDMERLALHTKNSPLVSMFNSSLYTYPPRLHQLLNPLLPHLRQYPHNNQIQNLIRQMLIQVRVSPNLQFRLYFLDDILSRQIRSTIQDIRKQRGQRLGAVSFYLYLLLWGRRIWSWWW